MPESIRHYRVFVASPDDVKEERASLEDVVRELNLLWSKHLGVCLDLIRWETHAYPGVGSEPQAVIADQIGDDYDIFLGLMWTRFGTPTRSAGSGTVEEFNRAYQRHRLHPGTVGIMFYFKDAPVNPSSVDPGQLALIRKFQSSLGEKGTFYWTFLGRDDFASLIRMHLSRQMQQWWIQPAQRRPLMEQDPAASGSSAVPDRGDPLRGDDTEEGLVNLIAQAQEHGNRTVEALEQITGAITAIGEKLDQRAREVAGIAAPGASPMEGKRIFDAAAQDMNEFASAMEAQIPVFAESYSSSLSAFARAASLAYSINTSSPESIQTAFEKVQKITSKLEAAQQQIRSLRKSAAAVPGITRSLNRATRRVVENLDRLDQEMTAGANLGFEILKQMQYGLQTPGIVRPLSVR